MASPARLADGRGALLTLAREALGGGQNDSRSGWSVTNADRSLEIEIGDVHSDRSVPIPKTLQLRADRPGRHEVGWTLYSKSSGRPARGTLVIVMPDDGRDRPPFGRLAGITSYPDVPIVDEDGEIAHDARTSDPPARPQRVTRESDDLIDRMLGSREIMEWEALGLDPALRWVARIGGPRRAPSGAADSPSPNE